MWLLLFRHGIAEPGDDTTHDADRALTPRGIERTLLAAQGLARIADRPGVILTSPKARAAQTAALLGDVFDMAPRAVPALAEGDPAVVLRVLRDRTEDRVVLVGHEPTMSGLVERLCAPETPCSFVELKKAGCALVEAPIRGDEPPGRGRLRWLLPPRVLRTLGEQR